MLQCQDKDSSQVTYGFKFKYQADQKTLKINPEAQSIIESMSYGPKKEILNSHFQDKPAKITCEIKKVSGEDENGAYSYDEYYIVNIDRGLPTYSTATCRIHKNGELVGIVEDQKTYSINSDGKKYHEMPIQNKNEICQGAKCLKITVDAEGYIVIYNLPNTTDARVVGKFVGNQIYPTKSKEEWAKVDLKQLSKGLEYKGDKNQAAAICVREQFFR